MGMVLALDKGNRSLKAALFDSGRIIARWKDDSPKPGSALRRIVSDAIRSARSKEEIAGSASTLRGRRSRGGYKQISPPLGAIYASVVPQWNSAIRASLRSAGIRPVIETDSRLKFPFALLISSPQTVGADRLAAASGVMALGFKDAVIVDAGTAVTVDILAGGSFMGGSIFPGKSLLLETLHRGTARLPRVVPSEDRVRIPGRDTEKAMLAGVHWGYLGAINEIVRRSMAALPEGAAVWVTGGGGEELSNHLGQDARYESDLVAVGLHYIFKLNNQ